MQRIPLHYYIAFNNPSAAKEVMESFGYGVHVQNKEGLANTIAEFLARENEKGLEAIAMIHPDRELILATANTTMGADGNMDVKSSVVQPASQPTNFLQPNSNPIVIGGIFTLGLIVLAIIAKK